MTIATLAVLLLLAACTWHCDSAHTVHERMSEAEIRRVFRVASLDQVPSYELVQLRAPARRAVRAATGHAASTRKDVSLTAFGRRYALRLHRNKDFDRRAARLKMFAAETTPHGLAYTPVNLKDETAPGKGWDGGAYHDKANMAALVLSTDGRGRLRMEGTLGHDLVISPLPVNLNVSRDETYYDVRGSADDEGFLDEDGPEPRHVVFKRPSSSSVPHESPISDYAHLEDIQLRHINASSSTSRSRGRRRRRGVGGGPDTVWPEVLLIVDYDTYLLHGRSHTDIKRYLVSFWNGVDLRYRLLNGPRVRISLAGMIVAKDRDATPYLERNRLRSPNEDAIDVAGALTDMGKYLFREDRLPTYDLAVVVTKLDMCRRHLEGGRCNRGTAGFAYVGGACVVNKRLEKVNSVAIIEDSGGFSGIMVAAHEVGHLLGCVHDGSPAPGYLGGPGAQRCPWEDGFIMSDLRHTERGFRWSPCSVQQFRHFLLGETATCLYNYPHENQLLARMLPGSMLSLDDQCRRDRGTTACFKDSRVCAQLFCYDSSSGYCVSYRPAAEGSPCGDGQTCKNGRCIAEIENIIPDYTHVTPSFASRSVSGRDSGVRRRADVSEEVMAGLPPPPPLPPPRAPDTAHRRQQVRPRTTRKPRTAFSDKGCTGDSSELIAGRMTCAEFLQQFGTRYCTHAYIQRHCCYSQSVFCS